MCLQGFCAGKGPLAFLRAHRLAVLCVYAVGIGSFFWSLFRITEVRMLCQKPRARAGGGAGHVWLFPLFSVQNHPNRRDRKR